MSEFKINTNYKIAIFSVNHSEMSWKYTLVSMFAYMSQPIVLPIMILFSKLLKREIKFSPVYFQTPNKQMNSDKESQPSGASCLIGSAFLVGY